MFLSALLNIHLAFYVGYGKMDSSSPSGISAHVYMGLTGMETGAIQPWLVC